MKEYVLTFLSEKEIAGRRVCACRAGTYEIPLDRPQPPPCGEPVSVSYQEITGEGLGVREERFLCDHHARTFAKIRVDFWTPAPDGWGGKRL